MRRVQANEGDLFRPRGQLARELALAAEAPGDVIRLLGPRLTDERRARIDDVVDHRTRRLVVAVEGVHDPHNTAAVIRTADAFGVQEVHVIEGQLPFVSSRKVTQGAHKWVDISSWSTPRRFVEQMRQLRRRVLVAAADGARPVAEVDLSEPTALVFGNESEGISPELRSLADGAVAIPMFGFVESLNISVAAAVTIAALRADGQGDLSPDEAAELRARFYLRAVRAGYDIVSVEREREAKRSE